VLSRKTAGIIDAVAFERLLAAISPPSHQIAVRTLLVGGSKKHLFMVATKGGKVTILRPPTVDQQIQDLLALWARSM
jgi:hypothetical protein